MSFGLVNDTHDDPRLEQREPRMQPPVRDRGPDDPRSCPGLPPAWQALGPASSVRTLPRTNSLLFQSFPRFPYHPVDGFDQRASSMPPAALE